MIKVLIVDDDVLFRSLLRDSLVDEGFVVHLADNGEDGIRKLIEQEVDFVISDLHMHVMDGLTFCKTARSDARFKNMPFIFVSAYGDTQILAQVSSLGNSAFVSKGRPANELLQLIKQFGTMEKPTEAQPFSEVIQALSQGAGQLKESPAPDLTQQTKMPEHPRILVVDDDDALRMVLSDILLKEGFVVTTAIDGQAAIELLRNHTYDLVLLNIFMPNISGYGVLTFINEHNISTKIIMLTAYSELKLAVECKELGADDFIGKPFMRRDLLNTIRQVLTK